MLVEDVRLQPVGSLEQDVWMWLIRDDEHYIIVEEDGKYVLMRAMESGKAEEFFPVFRADSLTVAVRVYKLR